MLFFFLCNIIKFVLPYRVMLISRQGRRQGFAKNFLAPPPPTVCSPPPPNFLWNQENKHFHLFYEMVKTDDFLRVLSPLKMSCPLFAPPKKCWCWRCHCFKVSKINVIIEAGTIFSLYSIRHSVSPLPSFKRILKSNFLIVDSNNCYFCHRLCSVYIFCSFMESAVILFVVIVLL